MSELYDEVKRMGKVVLFWIIPYTTFMVIIEGLYKGSMEAVDYNPVPILIGAIIGLIILIYLRRQDQ